MAKTWAEKMRTPPAHIAILEKPFGGVPQGARLLISSPTDIAAWLRALPTGEFHSITEMRQALASAAGADAACPVSTSIFLRIVAEAAWDDLAAGAAVDTIAPFWRVMEPDSAIAKKLRADSNFIATQRERERAAS
jgi:hypothetical protein